MPRFSAKFLLPAAGMLLCSLSISAGTAQAGPTLETTQENTVGTQATYDNSWAQSFQVTGNASVNGVEGTITPFSAVDGVAIPVPNSGTAVVSATVDICTTCESFTGTVTGEASISPAAAYNNINLNTSSADGVPAITLNSSQQPSAGFGAVVNGDNIGTASLQTQGTVKTINSNTLTVF